MVRCNTVLGIYMSMQFNFDVARSCILYVRIGARNPDPIPIMFCLFRRKRLGERLSLMNR